LIFRALKTNWLRFLFVACGVGLSQQANSLKGYAIIFMASISLNCRIMNNITIRLIQQKDDLGIARIIRESLELNNANKPGTVYYDASTDHLSDLFTVKGSVYFVAESNEHLLGGCGIYPTAGLPEGTGELVKLYLDEKAQGKGIGKALFNRSLDAAKEMGYQNVYIETMPELKKAIPLYEQAGFTYLPGPLGNSGHDGCGIWMMKAL